MAKEYTVEQGAKLLGLNYDRTIYLIRSGALRAERRDRELRIPASAIEQFRASRAARAPDGIHGAPVIAEELLDFAILVGHFNQAKIDSEIVLQSLRDAAAQARTAGNALRAETAEDLARQLPLGVFSWDGRKWTVAYPPHAFSAPGPRPGA